MMRDRLPLFLLVLPGIALWVWGAWRDLRKVKPVRRFEVVEGNAAQSTRSRDESFDNNRSPMQNPASISKNGQLAKP